MLALIPAKHHSSRLAGKNNLLFCGAPLFLHSALYAKQEGIEPVVFTDSPDIRRICDENGIRHIPQQPDENPDALARQALSLLPECDALAWLQPTSPLRKPGMLAAMARRLEDGQADTLFTADTAHTLSGKVPRFDGSIIVSTRAAVEASGLLHSAAVPVPNQWPFTQEIDTAAQFEGLQFLAHHAAFNSALAYRPQLRVLIIGNKTDPARDYSQEFDAFDIIMRINSFDNLDSGLTGTRTDVALITAGDLYRSYTDEHNHVEHLRSVPRIFFYSAQAQGARAFAREKGLTNWALTPLYIDATAADFTTLGKGIVLAQLIFPHASYALYADILTASRTEDPRHLASSEDAYIRALVTSGKLTIIQ